MSRTLLWGASLAVVAGVAWQVQGAGGLDSPEPRAGLHRCARGAAVTYTDGPCPAGSTSQLVTNGAVTVLPGRVDWDRSSVSDRGLVVPSSARQARVPEAPPELRARAIERVVNP